MESSTKTAKVDHQDVIDADLACTIAEHDLAVTEVENADESWA